MGTRLCVSEQNILFHLIFHNHKEFLFIILFHKPLFQNNHKKKFYPNMHVSFKEFMQLVQGTQLVSKEVSVFAKLPSSTSAMLCYLKECDDLTPCSAPLWPIPNHFLPSLMACLIAVREQSLSQLNSFCFGSFYLRYSSSGSQLTLPLLSWGLSYTSCP